MPVYHYACSSCAHEFDQRQSFADDPLTDCPSCDEGAVRRVIQPVGVVFKGTGWYLTDSRKPESTDAAPKGDAKNDATTDAKDATDKPAAKSGNASETTASDNGKSKSEPTPAKKSVESKPAAAAAT